MNKRKKIIAVVGKTSTGKDTISKYMHEKYNVPFVISYTTRPMRDYETDGKEHYFITKERMSELISDKKNIIAYTINAKTGIEYCATKECIKDDYAIYIVNPDGIEWLKQNCPDIDVVSIYLNLDESEIIKRGTERGDDIKRLKTRLDSEREEFDTYMESKKWDYLIDTRFERDLVYAEVDVIMEEVL